MGKRIRKETISVRMPIDLLEELDDLVQAKQYRDRSEAIITKIQDGNHLHELMEIAKDPELQKEMNEKIKSMLVNSDIEQTLQTMSIKEREAIIFYATHLNQQTLKQTAFGG